MSMKLNDSVIMRLWSENKGHHHIKDPWTLSKVMCDEVKKITQHHGFLTESWGQLVSRDGTKTRKTRII